MMDERAGEVFRLPAYIADAHEAAFLSEVFHHVFATFGYDLSAIDAEDQECLLKDIHELTNHDGIALGRAACRAFALFVKENGGEAAFGFSPGAIAEWI